MAQRAPSLVLAFLLAGVSAHAGFATASSGGERPRSERVRSPVTATTTTTTTNSTTASVTYGEPPANQPNAARHDWPTRIEDALARLHPATVVEGATDPELVTRFDPLVSRSRGRTIGVHVRDLESGRVLYDHEGDHALVPASNQKLLTAAAALWLLGGDHRHRTSVWRDENTLYLVGEGDPGLMAHDLHALVTRTIGTGMLEGIERIVVDDSAFGDAQRTFGDDSSDGPSYLAPSGALSLSFNTVEVRVHPTTPGAAAEITVLPASTSVHVVGTVLTGRGPGLSVRSRSDENGVTIIEVAGSIAPNRRDVAVRRRVADPALFTGGAFAALAARQAATDPLPVARGRVPESAVLVAEHESPALVDLLDSAMKWSNNFTSEQTLRTLGLRATGTGTVEAGAEVLERFAAALGHVGDVRVVDGSGLDTSGRASPRALVDFVASGGRAGGPLLAAMAHAGGDGTLRHRNAWAGARVRAKTGTLRGVTALSGVVTSSDGRRNWAFSILINGGKADDNRRLQDRMIAHLLNHAG